VLWQTKYEDPPVDVASAAPEAGDGFLSDCDVVVAVRLGGAALIVVSLPSIVVRTGVIVAIGDPFASTVTHGFNADSVTVVR
jgi:hypothetical protein